jgi:hypothetical protein
MFVYILIIEAVYHIVLTYNYVKNNNVHVKSNSYLARLDYV